MITGMTRGRVVCRGTLLTAGLLMAAGPAVGQSTWAERAREVAAARLAQGEPASAPQQVGGMHASQIGGPLRLPAFQLAFAPETAPAEEAPAASGKSEETGGEMVIERGPLPGLFETIGRDLKEAPRTLWRDTKATYGNPWNLAFLVGAGGASLALRPEADDRVEDHFRKHHTFPQGERDTFDWLGNPGTGFAIAGLMYVAGQTLQEAKTYEVGKRAFSALIITDLSTLLLKAAANTHGPNGENFSWPSGHVSSTVALATILNDAYGPLVGAPAYGVAVFSGIERLDSREHHLSDVVFGAALGWVVAESVMKEHRNEIFGGELVPYWDLDRATAGIAWVKPLGNK